MRNGFLAAALVYLLFLLPMVGSAFPLTPDPQRSPGALCTRSDPDYAEDRYGERIPYCQRNVSSSTKKSIYRVYGIPRHCTNRYTIDHLIPLSIGGDNSIRNLWPEHKFIKATRQNLEEKLYWAMSNGQLLQQEAVEQVLREKLNPPSPTSSSNECDLLDPQAHWDRLNDATWPFVEKLEPTHFSHETEIN